jgi:gliding motility-associated lipoprotein GldH
LIVQNKIEINAAIKARGKTKITLKVKVKEEIEGKILEEINLRIRTIIEIVNLNKMRNSIAFIMLLILFVSCDTGVTVSKTKSLSGVWNKSEVVSFDIPQLDSIKIYNVFLHIRNSNEYKYNNLFLIVSMNFPHGKTVTDTLEYRMANLDGTWLGDGIGSIKENKFWYKEDVSFIEDGIYTISISQAVRNNGDVDGVTNLEGITDVGFSVEEVLQQ